MKVIIAGSRDFNDYELLKNKCDKILSQQSEIEIISGTAKGADTLGEKYAKEKGYVITKFPADWENKGNSAGYLRNEQMAKYADTLIAFWNGRSCGTKHMIDLAYQYKLKVRVIFIK